MAQVVHETGSPADLKRWHDGVAAELDWADDAGYFGPGSAMWQVNRELVLGLGLGRAVLMELAHPWVAQALIDHSRIHANPVERLLETAKAAEVLVFGSRRQADEIATRIRKVHRHIHGTLREDVGRWKAGTIYRADDPEALLWVLATLVDTALVVHTSCFGRLPPHVETAYIEDSALLGSMLGIPREMVWRDRSALTSYIDDRIADGTVCVGRVGSRLANDFIELSSSPRANRWWRLYSSSALTLATLSMPEALLRQFDLPLSPRQRTTYRSIGRIARLALRRLPVAVRVDPITRKAMRRSNIYPRLSRRGPQYQM